MMLSSIISILGTQSGGGIAPLPQYADLTDAIIACDGNSLTAGQGGTAYPTQLAALAPFDTNGAIISNWGVGGQTTQQMAADAATQIDPLITQGVTNILLAWEIGNDLYYNGNPAACVSRFADYCLARKGAGWDYVLCFTLTPRDQDTSFYGTDRAAYQAALDSCNTILRSSWATFSDGLIDLQADSRLSSITPTYWSNDNVHLNTSGYGVVAEKTVDKLTSLLI